MKNIKLQNIKNQKKTLHKGRETNFSADEQKLILELVETSLENYIPINYMLIAQKVRILNFKSTGNISFCALYKRVEKF